MSDNTATDKPRKVPKPPTATLKTRKTKINMGHTLTTTKWQNIYKKMVNSMQDAINTDVEDHHKTPRSMAIDNPAKAALVVPERRNSTITSIITQPSFKTKKSTTMTDNKGQKELHGSTPRGKSSKTLAFFLPPVYYPKSKELKVKDAVTASDKITNQTGAKIKKGEPLRNPAVKRGSNDKKEHVKKIRSETKADSSSAAVKVVKN